MITHWTDNVMKVTGTAHIACGLWAKVKVRKAWVCKLSGKVIAPGEEAYMPFARIDRDQRVRADVMENYADPRLFAKYSRAK